MILQGYFPTLKTVFPLIEIKTFEGGTPAYDETLSKLEKRLKRNHKTDFSFFYRISGETAVAP